METTAPMARVVSFTMSMNDLETHTLLDKLSHSTCAIVHVDGQKYQVMRASKNKGGESCTFEARAIDLSRYDRSEIGPPELLESVGRFVWPEFDPGMPPLTVGSLIEQLSKLPQDAPVFVRENDDDGCWYSPAKYVEPCRDGDAEGFTIE